jgi:hypothetical protein
MVLSKWNLHVILLLKMTAFYIIYKGFVSMQKAWNLHRLGGNLRSHFFYWLYSPYRPWPLFQFPDLFTLGRTPWTSDQLVAMSLSKHSTTQTQNKHIYTPNIYTLIGFRTHDHSVRASKDSSCLRPLGYRERRDSLYSLKNRRN